MEITRTKETQHIAINQTALKAFLLEQGFEPSFLQDLHIIIAPVATVDEVDDQMDEDLALALDLWLYTKGHTAEEINCQLIEGVRFACHQYAIFYPSAAKSLKNFGVASGDPNDVRLFGEQHGPSHQFVSLSETVYPLFETDREKRRNPVLQPVSVHCPFRFILTAVCAFGASCVLIGRGLWSIIKEPQRSKSDDGTSF